jgi:hypothetical protein
MRTDREFTDKQKELIRQMIREGIRNDWATLNLDIGYGILVKKSSINVKTSKHSIKNRNHHQ